MQKDFLHLLKEIEEKVRVVKEDIKKYASASEVTIVAVTKSASIDQILAVLSLGIVDIAENRIPQFLSRKSMIECLALNRDPPTEQKIVENPSPDALTAYRKAGFPRPVWHFIGPLHKSHANKVVGECALIHSVDSLALAERISRVAKIKGIVQDVLLEVNISGEEQKHGFNAERLYETAPALAALEGISIKGLMTMAPFTPDTAIQASVFRGLKELSLRLENKGYNWSYLSMGMSNDYIEALKAGATHIRIGTALFE
ncbi:MAG: YggS family pyridoxal phosphate-dependent enzyme [Thermoplasmata archaeon]